MPSGATALVRPTESGGSVCFVVVVWAVVPRHLAYRDRTGGELGTALLVAETQPDVGRVRSKQVRGIHLYFMREYPFRIAWLCVLTLLILGSLVTFNVVMILFSPYAWLLSPFVLWYSLLVLAIVLHLALSKTTMLVLDPPPAASASAEEVRAK